MRYLLVFSAFVILFSSCEKVITLPVKDEDPKVVIEAVLNADQTTHQIKLSRTLALDATSAYPSISNAAVSITDQNGTIGNFNHIGDGVYELVSYPITEGYTYTLVVTVDGVNYQGTSTVPIKVPLNGVDYIDNQFFGATGYLLVPQFTDAPNVANYYGFSYTGKTEGGRYAIDLIIREDESSDGLANGQPLFEGPEVNTGDTVSLYMNCFDKATYKYYFSRFQTTDPNSGAPANPVTNLSNGALGYFTVRTQDSLVFIVP